MHAGRGQPHALRPAQQLSCCRNHPVRLEAEFPLEFLGRRRASESLHPDHMAGSACANGIDTQLIDFHACHWLSNLRRGLRPSRSGAPPSAGLYRSTSCAVWFRPHAGRYPPRLYSAASCPTAARSASSRACSPRTRPAGIDTSASRKRRSISTFSLPVTTQSTRRARLSIG